MDNDHWHTPYFEQDEGYLTGEGGSSSSRVCLLQNIRPKSWSSETINYLGIFDFELSPDDYCTGQESFEIARASSFSDDASPGLGWESISKYDDVSLSDASSIYHDYSPRHMSIWEEPYYGYHYHPQQQSIHVDDNGFDTLPPADEEKTGLISSVQDGPDGGLRGWIQVVAAFLLVLDGFGFITAFGVFQAYYVKLLPQSPSEISWIGSVQIFLLFLLGTISGRAIDAGHFRSTVLLGFVFQLGGVFGASFASQYWHFLLSQGIATGIGNGLHFTALVWLVSQYFTKRRGLALGFSSCGAPIGAVVFTVIARELIPRVGIQWTLRVMGFIILGNSIAIYLIARPKKAARKSGPFLELSAFSEPPYLFFCIGMFFAMLGLYFAYYYVPLFARNELNLGDDSALLTLIIMSAVGITGRLIPPFLADRFFRPLRTLVAALLLSSLNVFAWTAVASPAGLTAWVVAYAFTANAVQTLFTASMGEVTADMTRLGVRIGMIFTLVSFACLAGPPIGGRLVQYGEGDFVYAQIFAAACMLVGGLLVAVAKVKQVGWRGSWRMV